MLDVRRVKINLKQRAWRLPDPNYSRELAVGNAPDVRQLPDRAPARRVSGIPRCDRARGYVVSDGTNWRVVVALRRALEDAGIEFIERGKRGGPGVSLRE